MQSGTPDGPAFPLSLMLFFLDASPRREHKGKGGIDLIRVAAKVSPYRLFLQEVVKSRIPVIIWVVHKEPVMIIGIERSLRDPLSYHIMDVLWKVFLSSESCLGCKAACNILEMC